VNVIKKLQHKKPYYLKGIKWRYKMREMNLPSGKKVKVKCNVTKIICKASLSGQ
jgi:hypothetical protein